MITFLVILVAETPSAWFNSLFNSILEFSSHRWRNDFGTYLCDLEAFIAA